MHSMPLTARSRTLLLGIFPTLLAVSPTLSFAESRAVTLALETGPAWFSRSDVRIPTDTGTRYDMLDLTGTGPIPYARLHATYAWNDRHSVRLTLAPLEASGVGEFAQDVDFVDDTFAANTATYGSYRFNTYRMSYRWLFHQTERHEWGVGGTLLVRDAKIELKQGQRNQLDDDLGVVPLLHLYGAYHWQNWSLVLDVDAAAASQGRAIDLALMMQRQIDDHWFVAGGYRVLDGGADNDSLYTFARVHFGALSVGYRF